MKLYYYLDENKLCGPLHVEEMRWKGLTKETLVWTDGMDDWERAGDIAEIITIPAAESVADRPFSIRFISYIAGILLKIKHLPGLIRNYNLTPVVNLSRVIKQSISGLLFRLSRFYQFIVK
jgi:hypothetical protein